MPFNDLNPSLAVDLGEITDGEPRTNEGKTLLSMTTELTLRLGDRDDIDTARYHEAINEAYRDMFATLRIPEVIISKTFVLTAGSYLYKLPKAVGQTISAATEDSVAPLAKTDLASYRKLPDEDDYIRSFFRFGERYLVVWPTPTTAENLVLDFHLIPDDLEDDTDSPILQRHWHKPLETLAQAFLHEGQGEEEEFQLRMNSYISMVRRKLDTAAEEKEGMVAAFRSVRNIRNASRMSRRNLPQ